MRFAREHMNSRFNLDLRENFWRSYWSYRAHFQKHGTRHRLLAVVFPRPVVTALIATCFGFPRSTRLPTPRSQSSSGLVRGSLLPGKLPRRPLSCSTAPSRRGRITPPGTTQTGPARSAAAMESSSPAAAHRMHLDLSPPPPGVCYQRGFLFTSCAMCASRKRRRRRDRR